MNTNDYKRKEDESYIVCSTVCDGENKRRKRKKIPSIKTREKNRKPRNLTKKIEENIIFSRNRLNRIIELIAWKIRDPEEHGG